MATACQSSGRVAYDGLLMGSGRILDLAAEVMAGTRRRCLVRPDKPTRDDRYIMERCVLYMLYKKYTILVINIPILI